MTVLVLCLLNYKHFSEAICHELFWDLHPLIDEEWLWACRLQAVNPLERPGIKWGDLNDNSRTIKKFCVLKEEILKIPPISGKFLTYGAELAACWDEDIHICRFINNCNNTIPFRTISSGLLKILGTFKRNQSRFIYLKLLI